MLTEFNLAAIERAKSELKVLQSNIIAKLEDGSELRAVWEGWRFVDQDFGLPFDSGVVDFWEDQTLPVGGLLARCAP